MKHFGAALASYGSVALFHMIGVTPEAQRIADVIAPDRTLPTHAINEADIRAFAASYLRGIDNVDLVVFSAPQLSLVEVQEVADLLDGRRASIPLRIEGAGGTVLAGMCFYQSYAREMAEANGWKRLATNSAKLVNIIGGYGYKPALLSMAACIDAACAGGRVGR
jgi:predicted aconitase